MLSVRTANCTVYALFLLHPKVNMTHLLAGHASNSISAALGMAVAAKKNGENTPAMSLLVIGDGSMSGGLALKD